jgi:hypothetical protein
VGALRASAQAVGALGAQLGAPLGVRGHRCDDGHQRWSSLACFSMNQSRAVETQRPVELDDLAGSRTRSYLPAPCRVPPVQRIIELSYRAPWDPPTLSSESWEVAGCPVFSWPRSGRLGERWS